jgi:uncharacterized small protein (DUF1192 family)
MADGEKLYTLTEVAKRTKISMPTLQRYKKMFNDRIPSDGDGRSQRYPESAIEIFNQLKSENSKKRGRPRKNAAGSASERPAAASRASAAAPPEKAPKAAKAAPAPKKVEEKGLPEGWLSLKDIEDTTRISYPTLLRYLRMSGKRIPHRGTGRKRSFPPEAVAIFKTLREESRRGRKPGSGKKAAGAAAPAPASANTAAAAAPAPRKAAAAPAPPSAPKRRGRPPKSGNAPSAAPAAASNASQGDSGLVGTVRELQRTVAALQKQVARLEADLHKPFKVMLSR